MLMKERLFFPEKEQIWPKRKRKLLRKRRNSSLLCELLIKKNGYLAVFFDAFIRFKHLVQNFPLIFSPLRSMVTF